MTTYGLEMRNGGVSLERRGVIYTYEHARYGASTLLENSDDIEASIIEWVMTPGELSSSIERLLMFSKPTNLTSRLCQLEERYGVAEGT